MYVGRQVSCPATRAGYTRLLICNTRLVGKSRHGCCPRSWSSYHHCLDDFIHEISFFLFFMTAGFFRLKPRAARLIADVCCVNVNRYKLLLEGMLKNTEKDHPDRPLLQNAIEQISDVASFINDSIKRRENQAKIWGACVSYSSSRRDS